MHTSQSKIQLSQLTKHTNQSAIVLYVVRHEQARGWSTQATHLTKQEPEIGRNTENTEDRVWQSNMAMCKISETKNLIVVKEYQQLYVSTQRSQLFRPKR